MLPGFSSYQMEKNNEWYRLQEFNSLGIVVTTVADLIIVANILTKILVFHRANKWSGVEGEKEWEWYGKQTSRP